MNGTPTAATSQQLDLLWKQYASNVDLYKFYLELAVKVNVFYYAITGAILSYYFQRSTDGIAQYALLLPVLFSFALGGVSLYGASLVHVVRQEMFRTRDALGFQTAPEFMVLIVFLRVLGGLQLVVGLTLMVYFLTLLR